MKRDWLLNTMVVLLMAIGSYTLNEVHTQGKTLSITAQMVFDGKEARLKAEQMNGQAHDKIESAVKDLISKREFDVRVADINTQLQDIRSRILTLELQFSKLKTIN